MSDIYSPYLCPNVRSLYSSSEDSYFEIRNWQEACVRRLFLLRLFQRAFLTELFGAWFGKQLSEFKSWQGRTVKVDPFVRSPEHLGWLLADSKVDLLFATGVHAYVICNVVDIAVNDCPFHSLLQRLNFGIKVCSILYAQVWQLANVYSVLLRVGSLDNEVYLLVDLEGGWIYLVHLILNWLNRIKRIKTEKDLILSECKQKYTSPRYVNYWDFAEV